LKCLKWPGAQEEPLSLGEEDGEAWRIVIDVTSVSECQLRPKLTTLGLQ